MKYLIILFPLLMVKFCDSSNSPTTNQGLSVSFILADTLGNQTATFHSGSSFDMIFSVTNKTGNSLSYTFTGTPVVFQVLAADTVVASSTDYYVFAQVVLTGRLENQATYTNQWRAPSTKARQIPLTLAPGQYKARILHGAFFNEAHLESTSVIPFIIVE